MLQLQAFFCVAQVEDGSELVQCSQALSILGDIVTIDSISKRDNELEGGEESPSSSASCSGTLAPASSLSPRRSISGVPPLCSMEETTMHLSKIFFLAEWPAHITSQNAPVEDVLVAFLDDSTPLSDSQQVDNMIKVSIQRLVSLSENLEGRKVLVNVLNQFRSKQVNVGVGFKLLAAVLWGLLTKCKSSNDVHNGKVVMMLSQVLNITNIFRHINCFLIADIL